MLPECRTAGDPYAIPEFDLEREDVEDFLGELKGYHEQFSDCFSRSEPRENFLQYMIGQFSELERKSIEPIALKVEGGNIRSMQRFVSDVVWNTERMLTRHHELVNEDMGDPNGVVIFDESGFVKKGEDSVGVAKQYCGNVGKVENCQVGVFAAYASRHGYALLNGRLFIPEKWFESSYEEKRKKCKIPNDSEFKTKPQLAAQMYRQLRGQELLPFKYVAADSIYGNSPDFIEAIEERVGTVYFVSMPSDTLCWRERPATKTKTYNYKGESRSKRIVPETEKENLSFIEMAKSIHSFFWYRRKVSEGTKGPIDYEFSKRRVTLCKDGLPTRTVWLIMKRTIGNNREYSFYISNAPLSTRLAIFVWLSGIRWAIEQCFEETKSELGMDHYEVRKYRGWTQHMLTCILAHFFLWHLKIRLGKKSTSYYSAAA